MSNETQDDTNIKVPDAEPVFINKELADPNNPPTAKPAVLTVPDDVSLANGISLLRPIVRVPVPETLTREELQKAQEGFSKMDDNDKENEDVYAGDKRIADDDDSQGVKQNDENVTSEIEKTPDLEPSVKQDETDDEKSIEDTVIENCDTLEQSFEKLVEKHSQLKGFLNLVKTHLADLKNRCTGLK